MCIYPYMYTYFYMYMYMHRFRYRYRYRYKYVCLEVHRPKLSFKPGSNLEKST